MGFFDHCGQKQCTVRLIIEGHLIPHKGIASWCKEHVSSREQWKQEIADTLMKWVDTKDYVGVHTSGSTGTPKVIQLNKYSMRESARMTLRYFHLQGGMRALLCLPAAYIAGKMMIVRAMVGDLDLVCEPPSSLPIKDEYGHLDFVAMTPMQVMGVLDQRSAAMEDIDQLIIGGAPVDQLLRSRIQKLTTRCYLTYGMTETITHIAVQRINGSSASSVFHTLEGVEVLESDGCLVIQAAHLGDIPIKTTDMVEVLDPYSFIWKGRADDVINSGGIKICPQAIEDKLSTMIDDSYVVLGEMDPVLGEKIVLLIAADAYPSHRIESLRSKMLLALDKYENPKKIYFVNRLIRTATGKVKRDINLYNLKSF